MEIVVKTEKRKQVVDLTDKVNEVIEETGIKRGMCHLFVTHTTCCLTTGEVGEGTDEDLLEVAEKLVPEISFRHAHDPSHAWSHMASSIIGPSLTLPVEEGRLVSGTWQSPLLIELDGPRERQIVIQILTSS